MMGRFAQTSFVLWLTATSAFASEECKLECRAPATCVLGDPPVQDSRWDNVEGMYCDCPEGWTGTFCEVPFVSCEGDHVCYHGGRCVPHLLDSFGPDELFCNCEQALDESRNRYFGKHCEQMVSQYCDAERKFFCVNGGLCNPGFPQMGEPCECPNAYFGEHCQYERGGVPELDCQLDCKNNGKCVLGEAPAEEQEDNGIHQYEGEAILDHQYCACTNGFDGETCEIAKAPCGDNFCYHGGTCTDREVEGKVVHYCDCSTASTNQHDYAGRFCQFKATDYCTKDIGLQGNLFCVNHGRCKENPMEGCTCEEPFAGFSCEFIKGETHHKNGTTTKHDMPLDPEDVSECDIGCQNDGVCRHGKKDLGILGAMKDNAPHLDVTHTNDYKHCVCPDGFTGLYCEQEAELCGEGEHLCLHGGTCVKKGEEDLCDCTDASGHKSKTGLYTGKSCEHPVNDVCTVDYPGPGQPLLFCVNGGSCKARVQIGEEHPGCICEEGFGGPHCEMSLNRNDLPPDVGDPVDPATTFTGEFPEPEPEPTTFQIIFVILFLLAILSTCVASLWFCISLIRRRIRRNAISENMRWASKYQDNPPEVNLAPRRSSSILEDYPVNEHASSTDPFVTHLATVRQSPEEDAEPQIYIGPPRDEDGHELHNVDII